MRHAGHMAGSRGQDWRYPVSRRRWAVKCHAHNGRGGPCGRYSIAGGFVCRSHGGALKRTIEAAQRRLAEAAATERMYQVGGDELVLIYRLITAPDPPGGTTSTGLPEPLATSSKPRPGQRDATGPGAGTTSIDGRRRSYA
jgi:hypothetical protein